MPFTAPSIKSREGGVAAATSPLSSSHDVPALGNSNKFPPGKRCESVFSCSWLRWGILTLPLPWDIFLLDLSGL